MARKNENAIYDIAEEILEANDSPLNGFEEAMQYLQGCKGKYRFVDEDTFLKRLSDRDDDIGILAKQHISPPDAD